MKRYPLLLGILLLGLAISGFAGEVQVLGGFSGGGGYGDSAWITGGTMFLIELPDFPGLSFTITSMTHAILAGDWRPLHAGLGLGLGFSSIDDYGRASIIGFSVGGAILSYGQIGPMLAVGFRTTGAEFIGTVAGTNINDLDVILRVGVNVLDNLSVHGRFEYMDTWGARFTSTDGALRFQPCGGSFLVEGGVAYVEKVNASCPWDPYKAVGFKGGAGLIIEGFRLRADVIGMWSTTRVNDPAQWGAEISFEIVSAP